MRALNIGILNLMHDKQATNERFTRVLTHGKLAVDLHFYYPVTHYAGRPVPPAVSTILEPLDLAAAAAMDGFIITGAPIETLPYSEVQYIDEIRALLARLAAAGHPQLYLCWGGMIALNYFNGISKFNLPHKLFGVYPHLELAASTLLAGLPSGFQAPHARYAEMDRTEIEQDPSLRLASTTTEGALFLVENVARQQTFMFAHLEYGRQGLLHEYQREVAAHPERHYLQPAHYFTDAKTMSGPQFRWHRTQGVFFDHWVAQVEAQRRKREQ